ncbi:MAG: hypothetical protein AAFX92_03890 [Pseudomonadota bacterium]
MADDTKRRALRLAPDTGTAGAPSRNQGRAGKGRRAPRFQIKRPEGTLIQAVSELVMSAGGVGPAGELVDRSKSQMARYTDEAAPDHMPVNVVRTLERIVGRPVVTRFLAASCGHALVPVNAGAADDPIGVDVARLAADFAKFFEDYQTAITDQVSPGEVDPREAGMLRVRLHEMLGSVGLLLRDLDEIQNPEAFGQNSDVRNQMSEGVL